MSSLLEDLKVDLTLYAKKSLSKGLKSPFIFEGPDILSAEVYDLMTFIEDQLDKYHLMHRFDYRFRSKSISESFTSKFVIEPFKKEDYVLPFLHHLAIQKDDVSAEDLHKYASDFLKKHAGYLSVHDIVILNSGAARAVTNIRFALNLLRKYSLVENLTYESRRSLRPTMLGILTLILVKLRMTDKSDDDTIFLDRKYRHLSTQYYFTYFPWISYKTPEEILTTLESFIELCPDLKEIDKIKQLVWEYYVFISEMLTLDVKKGTIKKHPYFDEKFMRFIKSDFYNWNHTDSIILLCNGYCNLWGLNK
jgi:hypothetical protein